MIHDIESALVAKVKEILAPFGFKVEPFPDNPDNYTMTHPKGVVLVVNKGSAYKGPHNLGTAMQERALSFELTVLVKNLRDHGGAYPVIDALAFGLAGWKAPGAIFGAVLEKDTFISRDASVWTWILQVGIRAYLIPRPPEDTDPPTSKIQSKQRETTEVIE